MCSAYVLITAVSSAFLLCSNHQVCPGFALNSVKPLVVPAPTVFHATLLSWHQLPVPEVTDGTSGTCLKVILVDVSLKHDWLKLCRSLLTFFWRVAGSGECTKQSGQKCKHLQKLVMFSCFIDKWLGLQLSGGSRSALASIQSNQNVIKKQSWQSLVSM